MKVLFEEENVTVHGKAVPETGQVSVIEYENPFKRELIWDPVAAGEWTFLGPSDYDSGFRVDLSQILTLRRPSTEGNGLRYLVIQLKDGAVLPSLHFTPGGVDRTCRCLNIFFKFKDSETEAGTLMVEAIEPPKGNNLSIWEDDPSERKKNQSNRDIVNQTFGLFSKITKAIEKHIIEEINGPTQVQNQSYEVMKYPGLARTEMPEIIREEPVSLEDFQQMISKGLTKELKDKIFKGGVTKEARPLVWRNILGLADEVDLAVARKDDYINLRSQWENLTPDQEQFCSLLRERRNLIGKDVIRTEPTRLEEPEIKRLSDLLTTYAIYDQDLGYVQGMSDIAVVILDIYDEDHVAFWVFAKLMQRIRGNFEKSQKAIKLQFNALRVLLAFTDRDMLQFFDERDTGHMFFTFPWFLIIFRRLCDWEQLPQLWDCWLTAPCSNFHLLFAAAILDVHRDKIMRPEHGYSEILQIINRLNGEIDLDQVLTHAQSLLAKIKITISTPPAVKQILSL